MSGLDPRFTANLLDVQTLGIIEIGKRCSVRDCHGAPVQVIPVRKPDSVGAYWLCAEHEQDVYADEKSPIVRVCGAPGEHQDNACGGAASYLAIVDIKDKGLRVMPMCPRHAAPMIEAHKAARSARPGATPDGRPSAPDSLSRRTQRASVISPSPTSDGLATSGEFARSLAAEQHEDPLTYPAGDAVA